MKKTTIANQPARQDNIRAIVAYFESGAATGPGRVGIELEHTIVEDGSQKPVSYTQENGVLSILESLKAHYPIASYDSEGDLLGVARPGEAVSLEPAAQLELSAGPFCELEDARSCFEAFEARLARILEPQGQRAALLGYHPKARAGELELIPKRRYRFMNFYLSEIGPFGPCMMRGSASTQVSIDYFSVADCLRKLRLAFALVPIISLVTDNAPIFEGQPRPHQLVRTKIWLECDPDRCGLVPGVMDAGFSLERYAEYILDTPAILVPCQNREWCYSEDSFGELYAKEVMGRADIEHAVSMFFNDVRLKTYIEIRPADAMPLPYVLAYAALIKGLFYSEEGLAVLDEIFAAVDAAAIDEAKEALMAQGYGAFVYGQPVAVLADRIMALAKAGLDETEVHFLSPLENLVSSRKTLADEAW